MPVRVPSGHPSPRGVQPLRGAGSCWTPSQCSTCLAFDGSLSGDVLHVAVCVSPPTLGVGDSHPRSAGLKFRGQLLPQHCGAQASEQTPWNLAVLI